MAGVNQTLMLSLSMVVIASIIGAPGLGQLVRRGINALDFGAGALGGVGLVLLAIVLDRMTQSLGEPKNGSAPTLTLSNFLALFKRRLPTIGARIK